MRLIELLSAGRDARKVSCTTVLQARCGIGLVAAKSVTDALLEDKRPVVTLQSDETARSLVEELASLGVRARFAKSQDYDPAAELLKAVEPLESILLRDVFQTIVSLTEHGEWEEALSHCLASLPLESDRLPSQTRDRLSELKLEFGLFRPAAKTRAGGSE